jgi:hypothetical protein
VDGRNVLNLKKRVAVIWAVVVRAKPNVQLVLLVHYILDGVHQREDELSEEVEDSSSLI